jgi:hypothetical protein
MSKSHCLFCIVCKLRSNSITLSFNIVLFCTRFATCVCNKTLSRFRWIISSSSDFVSFGSEPWFIVCVCLPFPFPHWHLAISCLSASNSCDTAVSNFDVHCQTTRHHLKKK